MKVRVPKMLPIPFPINDSNVFAGPVNDVPLMVQTHGQESNFVVCGGGKTGIDAVLELLKLGVARSHIVWVIPNDSWYVLREMLFHPKRLMQEYSNLMDAFLESSTSQEAMLKGEVEQSGKGMLCRLDTSIMPSKFKAATIGVDDLPKLRSINRVVRMGRIQRVEKGRLILEKGDYEISADSCLIDCTANGLAPVKAVPIFSGKRISLQPVTQLQQVYSAAIIAHMECNFSDKDESIKNEICTVVQHNVEARDVGLTMYLTSKTLLAMKKYGLFRFQFTSRLNYMTGIPLWRVLWTLLGPPNLSGKLEKFVAKVEKGDFSDIALPLNAPGVA